MDYMINVHGRLMDLSEPQVMGILNVTPDSFYAGSRKQTEQEIAERAHQIIEQGGTMIDVGGCSTRPGCQVVSEVVSVDTFRPDVARMTVEEYGADIINDVSEGSTEMFRMVSRLRVPYILMSVQSTIREMLLSFAQEVQQLRDLGVNDIILDPGFGFGKSLEQNYQVMGELETLQVMSLPVLVGVSRKSMIFKLFGCTPMESLNGTSALNTISLMKGTSILRVHDVNEAVECCKIVQSLTVKNSE